jgi:hypothetical protein
VWPHSGVSVGSAGLWHVPTSAERAVVVGANCVDSLVAHVAHRHEAAEHEPHARAHHVFCVTVVHLVVSRTAGRQEQRLLTPGGCLGGGRSVVRALRTDDRRVFRHQQLRINFEHALGERVSLDVVLQSTRNDAWRPRPALLRDRNVQRRAVLAAPTGCKQLTPHLVGISAGSGKAASQAGENRDDRHPPSASFTLKLQIPPPTNTGNY